MCVIFSWCFWGFVFEFFQVFTSSVCVFEFYYFLFNIHSLIHTIYFMYLGEV